LPTPSAPSAALVKLVAMLKKYTVPSSFVAKIADISQFGLLTQLITKSQSFPSVTFIIFS
jgi:hypothetical protein